MTTVPAPNERPEAPLFSDGLGERVVAADGATGELLQILRIRPALTAVPSFEFALRERAARLANFRHAYYARVRRIDRVAGAGPRVVDRLGSRRRHAAVRHAARRARAQPAARHQRRALPDSSARAGRRAAARERARSRARSHRARAAGRDAARAPGDRRARDGGRRRAAAVQPRSAVAGVPDRDAAERRPVALRSPRRRHRHRPRGARARARPAAPRRRVPQPSADAAERSARAHRARRRAAALAAAARLAGARAAARYAPGVCLGAGSAVGARGDRRRRFDVRRRAGVARDVPLALHRGAPRAARRSDSRAPSQRVRPGDNGGDVPCDAHHAVRRSSAGGRTGGQPLGRIRGFAVTARSHQMEPTKVAPTKVAPAPAAPSYTTPAAYTPSPAPAAKTHDTWADATARRALGPRHATSPT